MMEQKYKKKFDCVAMKRALQEKIYEETKGMSAKERLEYTHEKISSSRFAFFLSLPQANIRYFSKEYTNPKT